MSVQTSTGVVALISDLRVVELRPMISVTIPHLECEARDCERPLMADCVWHEEAAGALHLLKICGFHLCGRCGTADCQPCSSRSAVRPRWNVSRTRCSRRLSAGTRSRCSGRGTST